MASKKKPGRVAEAAPVQVYLKGYQRERLERLAERLGTTKSEVVRRGIEALDQQVTDPAQHPLLGFIGLAGEGRDDYAELGYSVAREHDRFLAEVAEQEAAEFRKLRQPPRRRKRPRAR